MSSNLRCLLALALVLVVAACDDGGGKSTITDGVDDTAAETTPDQVNQNLSLLSLSPTFGSIEGGTAVVLSGSGFVDGAAVMFGDSAGLEVTFLTGYQLRAKTPAATMPGKVTVSVRNPDGETVSIADAFEYQEAFVPTIGWCNLHWPATTSSQPGADTEPFFGRVFIEGCTTGMQQCQALSGEFGYAPAGDPSTEPSAFTWVPATYNAAHVDDDNDEFMAPLNVAAEGSYVYAFRASWSFGGPGADWVYCDLDGTDNGFSTDQMGQLTVAADVVSIGWCSLQWPASTTTLPGEASEPIYGQVLAQGCSNGAARCAEVVAEVGYGPSGTDPAAAPNDYTWTAAAYNDTHTGDDNDEYQGSVTVAAEGRYSFAYRFSVDAGANWTFCDLDGTSNGLQTDQLGALTVGTPATTLTWCQIQYPTATSSVAGVASETLYGQAFVEGCTEAAAECSALTAEVGFGDPAADPTTYTWTAATYNPAHISDANDEFMGSVTATAEGTYAIAYRFSIDAGANWLLCDTDGSDGFQAAQATTFTVADKTVDWCNIQYPATTTTTANTASEPIYGRVFSLNCSEMGAYCAGMLAEVGLSDAATDPSTTPSAYTWTSAVYNAGHISDNNDEYSATLTPTATGTQAYVYRFSGDAGATWTYCDATDDNTFTAADAGVLTVN